MREAIEQRPVAIERSFHPEALNYKRETHRTAPLRFAIEHTVSSVFGIRREALWNASRGVARVALARQTAMYLAHTVGGLSLTEVGHMFERDRTTVAQPALLSKTDATTRTSTGRWNFWSVPSIASWLVAMG